MITVNQLAKHFGPVKAVDGISFDVPQGEILGLLGPNGAGKTTTLRLISGYLNPDAGAIEVGGLDARTDLESIRSLIGYLPEYNPLYQDLLVYDYLQYVAQMRGIPAGQREARTRDMVNVCGLADVVAKKIGELSKGNRQRVGLAQAMIHDPDILILDEPTAGLDPNQIIEIRDLIKRLGRQKTVILSSHILSEVEATCNRVIIVHQGKVVADGQPQELKHRAVDETRVYLKLQAPEGRAFDILRGLEGVRAVEPAANEGPDIHGYLVHSSSSRDLRPDIFRLAGQNGWVLYEMHREVVSLEDIFRKLTSSAS